MSLQNPAQNPKLKHKLSVADPAMGGPGGRPLIDPNLGLVMAAPNSLPQTRGQIFI